MAFEKRPAEVKDYTVDWSRHLLVNGADAGDTISVSAWSAETGIVIDDDSSTTTTATAWLSGGTEGVHYTVTNTVSTAQGRVFERSIVIQVKAAPAG